MLTTSFAVACGPVAGAVGLARFGGAERFVSFVVFEKFSLTRLPTGYE